MSRCWPIYALSLLLCLLSLEMSGQEFSVEGAVRDSLSARPLAGVLVVIGQNMIYSDETDAQGRFRIEGIRGDVTDITLLRSGYRTKTLPFSSAAAAEVLDLEMVPLSIGLPTFEVMSGRATEAMQAMPSTKGTGIYRGMKSEVITLDNVAVDVNANNARQVYNRIAGLNIWENDGAGIQLGIGARGLSPDRTSNFNVRQDLYDISADALGYPESYYTPVLAGVERIELVRGAAALQYGTQFGGLLNFELKKPPPVDSTELVISQTVSSFGLNDSITSPIASSTTFVGLGHSGAKSGIYAQYQHKQGQGWRERSDYEVHNAYVIMQHRWSDRWSASLDLTHMSYLAEQPGGLTDEVFATDPRRTDRFRNWFAVDWNIAALNLVFTPTPGLTVESRTFALHASREALGFLGQTQRPDPLDERDLISGRFDNVGHETRLLLRRKVDDGYWITSGGIRLYRGLNRTQQGSASDGDDADFSFAEEVERESSDYRFPNINLAAFVQTLLPLSERWSITPGLRYEHIDTRSDGSFRLLLNDAAGNVIEDTTLTDQRSRSRDFVLFGIGASHRWDDAELYMNLVQNYRAINFTDIQVRNQSLVIDPDIQDERGYNADIGLRGRQSDHLQYDVSLFALVYADRIGEYFTTDEQNRAVRYRSNVSDARTLGIEAFVEEDLSHFWKEEEEEEGANLSLFLNASYIDSRYTGSDISAFADKRVESVPRLTLRSGLAYRLERLTTSLQFSHVGDQFSDATNVGSDPRFPSTPNAVDGIIPAYTVLDASAGWLFGPVDLRLSVNNLLDARYFSRRASGYPGPGILPSDGRNLHLTIRWVMS